MTRNLLALAAASVLSLGILHAQPTAISVKQGTSITYRVKGGTDITQSLMGQQMNSNITNDGSLVLANKKTASEQIDWTWQLKAMQLKVKTKMPIGKPPDTTLTTRPAPFATDKVGRLIDGELNDAVLAQILQGGLQQFFAPILNRGLTVGESWETSRSDTAQRMGLNVVTTSRLRYTYEGNVDTLKQKTTRLRVEVVEMTSEGSGTLAQAGEATIKGKGSGASILYYSNRDGMLVAANQKNETSIDVTIKSAGVTMPMTYSISTSILRQ